MRPAVTIGLPVYNGADHLREALDALLSQSLGDFELIISDNASTDITEAISREYMRRDPRIRYARHRTNFGAAFNYYFLLDQATGPYFMWAAADDVWGPRFLETCHGLLEADPGAGMAMTAYVASSMLSPLLDRTFADPLACIELADRDPRVLTYARLPYSTHKDNLVYALWRTDAIRRIAVDLRRITGSDIVGMSMNDYALTLFRGRYSRDVLFFKRYRYIPPGHLLGPALSGVIRALRAITGRNRPKNSQKSTAALHLRHLESALAAAGLSPALVESILEANRQSLFRSLEQEQFGDPSSPG